MIANKDIGLPHGFQMVKYIYLMDSLFAEIYHKASKCKYL